MVFHHTHKNYIIENYRSYMQPSQQPQYDFQQQPQNHQTQYDPQQQPQNQQINHLLIPQQEKNGVPVALLVVVGIVIAILVTVVLAGALYAWAASLAEGGDEIQGTWHNPEQTFTFNNDGTLEDSTGEWSKWRVNGDNLYLTKSNEPDYEYYFKYQISDETFFIAPLNEDNSVASESCSVYAIEGVVWEDSKYNVWPSWCPDE